MMNREQALVLTALGDFLHRKKTIAAKQTYDWSALLECGTQHRLNGILFSQLGTQIPEPFYSTFRTEYLACIVRYRHRQDVIGQMDELLQRSGVDYFYVKGNLIGALYTNPMLRTVSDVDLMVPANQLAALHKRLVKAGCVRMEKGKTVWVYSKENVLFEFHTALIDSTHREDDAVVEYLSHCWDSVEQGKLNWNVHMIYLLLHLRKHYRSSGVGFRQFLDLAFAAQGGGLDWSYILEQMEQLGLRRFTVTVMNLCDLWFGTHCAPEKLDLNPGFVERSTDAIFRNGIFGFANEENQDNDLINTARSEGIPGLVIRLLLLPFPGYRELQCRRDFRFLRNRPWLLPAAWVWRFILVFKPGKAGKSHLSIHRFRDAIANRNDTYEEWGL